MSLLRYPLPRPAATPQLRLRLYNLPQPSASVISVTLLATQDQTTVVFAASDVPPPIELAATQDQPVVMHRRVIRGIPITQQPAVISGFDTVRRKTVVTQAETPTIADQIIIHYLTTVQEQVTQHLASLQYLFAIAQPQVALASTGGANTFSLIATQAQTSVVITSPGRVLAASQAQAATRTESHLRTLSATQSQTASRVWRLTRTLPTVQTSTQPVATRLHRRSGSPTQATTVILTVSPPFAPALYPEICYPTTASITRSSTTTQAQITAQDTTGSITGPDASASIVTDTRTAIITTEHDTTDTIDTCLIGGVVGAKR